MNLNLAGRHCVGDFLCGHATALQSLCDFNEFNFFYHDHDFDDVSCFFLYHELRSVCASIRSDSENANMLREMF